VNLPAKVRIVEVGPRDGLQNESRAVSAEEKIALVNALVDAGLADVEVSSFVRGDRIPQLADAAEIFAGIERRAGVRYWALVPNAKGLAAARAARATHVAFFTAASDGFSRANTGVSVEESLARLRPAIAEAKAGGLVVRGYVSTVFGCPYDGTVDPARAAAVSRTLRDAGCDELSLGDTIGVAAPRDVARALEAHEAMGVPRSTLALHFHDTRGRALANVWEGLRQGVTTYDASAGGLGGCPFAPGATGNLATEDLVDFLDRMDIQTGVRLDALAEASARITAALGRRPASRAWAAWASRRAS
jgi:hydroxymethylglutaryl-CoA lyase